MIAYIDLPLRGQSTVTGHEILVIGFWLPVSVVGSVSASSDPKLLYIDEDGSMGQAALSEVKINWRFDERRRQWIDIDTGEELGSDDDDGDGQN